MSIDKIKSLLHAAEQGDLKKLQALTQVLTVNCEDDQSNTPLHFAAANNHENVVQYLIKKGASLDGMNWSGWTAIMFASYYGHVGVVNILAQSKASADCKNVRLITPLVCAARCGHTGVVETLLSAGASVNCTDGSPALPPITPLMTAAQHGHLNVVSLLLQYGANVDYQSPVTKYTALMLAAMNGHFKVVELLVEKGSANTNLTNMLQQTALMLSSIKHRSKVENFLHEKTQHKPAARCNKKTRPSIIDASIQGKPNDVRAILRLHADVVDATDEKGATALIHASVRGFIEVVEVLLDNNANMDIQDQVHGWTALMQATMASHVPVVKLLLQRGADVRIKANTGLTAFDLSTVVGNPELSRLLVYAMQQVSLPVSSMQLADRDDKNSVKNWFSKMGGKMGLKSFRTQHHLSRVPVSPEQIAGGYSMAGGINEKEEENDELKRTSSIQSVLNIAKSHKGPQERARLTLVAPHVELPDDVVAPVLPPYSQLSSFDLPNLPMSSKSTGGEISPHSSSGESSALTGVRNNNGRKINRPQVNSSTSIAPVEVPDSPQSSLTSSSSFFSSVSRQKGPASMPPASRFQRQDAVPLAAEYAPTAPRNRRGSKSSSTLSVTFADTKARKSNSQSSLPSLPVDDVGMISVVQGSDIEGRQVKDEDVGALLQKLSLERYRSTFDEEQVDMEALSVMDDSDLKQLGINETIYRKKILSAVKKNGSNVRSYGALSSTPSPFASSPIKYGQSTVSAPSFLDRPIKPVAATGSYPLSFQAFQKR